jgi:hypothetical protein
MIETRIRALFNEVASGEPIPSRVDTQLAHHRGRVRLRWRRAGVATAPVLAAAAVVAVIISVGAIPFRPSSGQPAAGAAAPRQFSPLDPFVSFGWLPAGNKLVAGSTGGKRIGLVAGPKLHANSEWSLTVYAAGQCHLTAAARDLSCADPYLLGPDQAKITGRAPAVQGHRAFWSDSLLVWQYGRGGWARLGLPYPNDIRARRTPAAFAAAQRDAVKIAGHTRFGVATAPLVFPAQLTGLPRQWHVSSVYYLPADGVLRASMYALNADAAAGALAFDGGLTFQDNLPWIGIDPLTSPHNPCAFYPHRDGYVSTREVINGYRVIVSSMPDGNYPSQQACAGSAQGLSVFIAERGPHPAISAASLFGQHLRLLGPNPANWTSKPIG